MEGAQAAKCTCGRFARALLSEGVALPTVRPRFAASTGGAKERVAPPGAHSCGVPASWSRGRRRGVGPLDAGFSALLGVPAESPDSVGCNAAPPSRTLT